MPIRMSFGATPIADPIICVRSDHRQVADRIVEETGWLLFGINSATPSLLGST
jgi:hypothetical protein